MKLSVDEAEFSIDCPNCSCKITKTIGAARAEKHALCPSCGTKVRFNLSKFDIALKQIESKFSQAARKLSRTIKIDL